MNKYISIALVLLLCSCTRHEPIKSGVQGPFEATGIIPKADALKPPRVTLLDTCPAPRVIAIPAKPSTLIITTKKGKDTLHLAPPASKKAEFYTQMATYSAEQGLFSSINIIKRDKTGNLWFGTNGRGVSRYDGKSFTRYTTAQGLANNVVYSIAEDKAGNLWFGTGGGGVSSYDGKSFTNYTTAQGLANNIVYSIVEDKTGNLWFGTGAGVSRYGPSAALRTASRQGASALPQRGSSPFTSFTMAQGLAGNAVSSILQDKKGNLWFGTSGRGVSVYDGKSFTSYTTAQGLANNYIYCIAEDMNGNLWFGTDGGGVSRYDPSTAPRAGFNPFTTYSTAQGLASNVVFSIAEDRSGNLWFGTSGGGVCKYDPAAQFTRGGDSFTTYTNALGLASNNVRSVAVDNAGNLWFGTWGAGASRYDGKAFSSYSTEQGLGGDMVFSIAGDNAGNIWLGTYGGGVTRYGHGLASGEQATAGSNSFTTYTTGQGLAGKSVYGIVEDKDGNLWFGTNGGGLSKFDGKAFTTFTSAQGLANNRVAYTMQDKAGNLWIGTYGGGVSCFDGKSFTTYTTAQGLVNNNVWSIAQDNAGKFWFGTACGVSCLDPSAVPGKNSRPLPAGRVGFTNYTHEQGLANDKVHCLAEDKNGNLWFGTAEGGVSRYDGKTFITYTTVQGLANNTVQSIAEDKTSLANSGIWFGTNEGFSLLACYKKVAAAKQYGTAGKDSILPADNNLSNLALAENYTPIFEKYNFRNGYPVKDVNTNAMFIDRKGTIWAGTGDKLVRFDYSGIHKDTAPPHAFINAVKLGGENICWYDLLSGKPKMESKKPASEDSMAIINEEVAMFGDVLPEARRDSLRRKFDGVEFDSIARFYPIPLDLVLPYKNDNISFDFGATEFARPYLVNYQYKLEGYDKDWNPVTSRNTASFGNIHEGTYTFKLKAQSPDGAWSGPLTYTFTVLPPVYRTWWAYLVYILAVISAIYGFVHWRTTTVRKEKEHLEKVVAKRTAEVVGKNKELETINVEIGREKEEVEKQKKRSDELLLNILPEEIATELKDKGSTTARHFDNVTVLFTDFENFTQASEHMSPQGLIDELHACFKTFDEITDKYNVEKIKTIGDAYMAVAGLPTADPRHAENVVKAALEITAFMTNRFKTAGNRTFKIRVGIHSGSVVAGIVGVKKFAYDIWGDTVNTAARMEQNCEAGKINISQTTYGLVKDNFGFEYRGEIEAKNKGMLKMYYVLPGKDAAQGL